MALYLNILGFHIPSYGFMITLGVITANLFALYPLRKYKLNFDDMLILEAYTLLGAFLGAKLLYLFISYRDIDWSRMLEPQYFNYIMQSGFVFYGGLIGGLLLFLLAGKIHHIDWKPFIIHLIYLIPWIHGFGRIGCFLAGCCYGIPYDGPFAVQFPEHSIAPSDTTLFPVQLVEAICLLILAVVLAILDLKKSYPHTIAIYFIVYGILRFLLEYVRYDAVCGHLFALSTSQWISIGFVVGTICYLIRTSVSRKKA